jgi:hypothetical protein
VCAFAQIRFNDLAQKIAGLGGGVWCVAVGHSGALIGGLRLENSVSTMILCGCGVVAFAT